LSLSSRGLRVRSRGAVNGMWTPWRGFGLGKSIMIDPS
jgi:hypothetical protein